jgi:hypothetical protein
VGLTKTTTVTIPTLYYRAGIAVRNNNNSILIGDEEKG